MSPVERRFDFEGPKLEGYGVVIIILIIVLGGLVFFSQASTY